MNSLGCLLRKAMKIIPTEGFEYRVFVSTVTNDIGNLVPVYSEWTKINGSIQPGLASSFAARSISEDMLIRKELGIDISRNVITVYTDSKAMLKTVNGQDMPDQIRYQNKIFNIIKISNWHYMDGWQCLTCVEDTRERV